MNSAHSGLNTSNSMKMTKEFNSVKVLALNFIFHNFSAPIVVWRPLKIFPGGAMVPRPSYQHATVPFLGKDLKDCETVTFVLTLVLYANAIHSVLYIIGGKLYWTGKHYILSSDILGRTISVSASITQNFKISCCTGQMPLVACGRMKLQWFAVTTVCAKGTCMIMRFLD